MTDIYLNSYKHFSVLYPHTYYTLLYLYHTLTTSNYSLNIQAILEIKDLEPLLALLVQRKSELLENVELSNTPDETEANTCIFNLSARARVG
jgi:hypothetical protein